jgi:hypothetical protein
MIAGNEHTIASRETIGTDTAKQRLKITRRRAPTVS